MNKTFQRDFDIVNDAIKQKIFEMEFFDINFPIDIHCCKTYSLNQEWVTFHYEIEIHCAP